MKKVILTGVVSMFSMSLLFAQSGSQELPQNSRDFIAQHFASESIASVQVEDSWLPWDNDDMYEVHFSSGLELSFNKAGEITEIDAAKDQQLPMEVLPAEIQSYVGSNYQNAAVSSWEKDGKDQDVELSNGVDLEFDKNGKFVRVD